MCGWFNLNLAVSQILNALNWDKSQTFTDRVFDVNSASYHLV